MRSLAICFAISILAALPGGPARANGEDVGAAAADPSTIPALIAKMSPADATAFVGQVVDAAARMPLAPDLREKHMSAAILAACSAVPVEQRDEVLANALAHVPPRMLPGVVAATKAPFAALTAGLDDKAYGVFTADVLKAIDALELEQDDKVVTTTFAIVLLKRGAGTPEADHAFYAAALLAVPEAYRAVVESALPPTAAGDYTVLFGPAAEKFKLVVPVTQSDPTLELGGLTTLTTVDRTADETIYIDVGLERPSVVPMGEGPASPEATPSPTVPSPPLPPPYKGQW